MAVCGRRMLLIVNVLLLLLVGRLLYCSCNLLLFCDKRLACQIVFVMPPLGDVEKYLHHVYCGCVALGVKMRRTDFSCSAVIAKGFLRYLFTFQFCSACFSNIAGVCSRCCVVGVPVKGGFLFVSMQEVSFLRFFGAKWWFRRNYM